MGGNNSLKYGFITGAVLGVLVFWIPRVSESPTERLPASDGSAAASAESPASLEDLFRQAAANRQVVGALLWGQSYDPSIAVILLEQIHGLGMNPADVVQRLVDVARRNVALFDVPAALMKSDPAMARDRMMSNDLGVYFALRTLALASPGVAEPLLLAEATACKTAIPCAGAFHGMLDLGGQPSGAAWSAVKNAFAKPLVASAAAIAVIGAKGSCELEGAWLLPRITLEAKDDFVFKQHAIRALAKLQCKAAIPELQRILEWSVANPNVRGSGPLHDASAAALVSLGAR